MRIKIKYQEKERECLMKLWRKDYDDILYLVEGTGGANLDLIEDEGNVVVYQSPNHSLEDIYHINLLYWIMQGDATELYDTNHDAVKLLSKEF